MSKQFYGEDKVKPARVAYLVMLSKNQNVARNHYEGLPQELLEETKTPTLKQMLALSENGHNPLSRGYETIDHKLTNHNPRAFLASQGRKMLYRA